MNIKPTQCVTRDSFQHPGIGFYRHLFCLDLPHLLHLIIFTKQISNHPTLLVIPPVVIHVAFIPAPSVTGNEIEEKRNRIALRILPYTPTTTTTDQPARSATVIGWLEKIRFLSNNRPPYLAWFALITTPFAAADCRCWVSPKAFLMIEEKLMKQLPNQHYCSEHYHLVLGHSDHQHHHVPARRLRPHHEGKQRDVVTSRGPQPWYSSSAPPIDKLKETGVVIRRLSHRSPPPTKIPKLMSFD